MRRPRNPRRGKSLFAIRQVFGIDSTRFANEDTHAAADFGDRDRYA
jgi:hypothetical protein